ncbi:hypothetical protein QUA42_09755 [Microcoleus sp. Pol11C2]|uniref:hypothetical protein n=1 Tax=Microcoleus sp. Pol11C2 TaxID=3055389 RepID=UPI002FD6D32F
MNIKFIIVLAYRSVLGDGGVDRASIKISTLANLPDNDRSLRSPKLGNNRLLNAIAYVQIYPKLAATIAIDTQ